MENDTIDVVCLVQSYAAQIPSPDQEARQGRAPQNDVMERTESNSSTAPQEPHKPPAVRDQRLGGGDNATMPEFLARDARELRPASGAATTALAAAQAKLQVNTSWGAATHKPAQRKGTSGTSILVSIVVVLSVCMPVAFFMLCCTGGKRERERPAAKRSAAPAAGKKPSMRALLSSHSMASSGSALSPSGSTAGLPPGTGSWWWSRLSKRSSDQRPAASSALSMHSQRSSISVLKQGDPSQWAPQHAALQSAIKPGGPQRRFVVPMDSLAELERKGTFQVRSEKGDFDMTVAVDRDASKGPRLAVSAAGNGAARPMTIMVGPSFADPAKLEIKDSGGSNYGLLEQTRDGAYVLSFNGAPLLVIDGADENSLHMCVRTGNHQPVATVSCSFATAGREAEEEETVELMLVTGADPTLVVTTVLAVLLLCAEECEDWDCR